MRGTDGIGPDGALLDEEVRETFRVGGESVEVAIRAEETTIAYASGSERSVPTGDLRFCPECLREGGFPLVEDGGPCPVHDEPLLPFSLEDYERFKLLHQYGPAGRTNPF